MAATEGSSNEIQVIWVGPQNRVGIGKMNLGLAPGILFCSELMALCFMSFVLVGYRKSFITSQEGMTQLRKFNAGLKRCPHEAVFAGKSFFESLPSSPHKTSNQRRLHLASPPPHHRHLPHHRCPVLAVMRMRAVTGASEGAAVKTRIHWIHHHGRN